MEVCKNFNEVRNYDLLDTKFHKTFFMICSNRYLLKNYENINGIIETLRTHTHKDENCIISSLNFHIKILKYIDKWF